MLLLNDQRLDERRRLVRPGGPLAPLFDSLAAELEPWLSRDLYVPAEKALLSRAGGRCEKDGVTLAFEPSEPHEHRCPQCGNTYTGELHHRAWITHYQLWLAERAVHASLFFALRGDERYARFGRSVLSALAARYLSYPNVDNVLGPTRPFFSTYLESIWLLQICVATDLLARTGDDSISAEVRTRIIEPSRALIGAFNEGLSNRQVWNNAALMAAAVLCGDQASLEDRVHGAGGVREHLARGVLEDGTWYEGENYHQFALRGLWYCVTLAEEQGIEFNADERRRLARSFVAPFLTALPDFTMPSRKDSQYAVSLRQWRLAELAELGFARTSNLMLADALARIYEGGHERRDTGRSRSTADAERNSPSGGLSRSDLGWRALLHAVPELPRRRAGAPRSVHQTGQGYAVFRRDGGAYVGFDYGQSGGGHGHPDRLNLTLYHRDSRWLDDLGTGSYVDSSLHWYRSTLAHNAPLFDGRSQPLSDGQLDAYDEREGLGWISASFRHPDLPGQFTRSLVVGPDYLVDELAWTAERPCRVELPWHFDGIPDRMSPSPCVLDGGDGLEDGFTFVEDSSVAELAASEVVTLVASRDSTQLRAWLTSSTAARVFNASGPGQPASTSRRFHVLRTDVSGTQSRATGTLRAVLSWSERPLAVAFTTDAVTVDYGDGERHVHRRAGSGWHVDLFAGSARSSIDLEGTVAAERVVTGRAPLESPIELRRAGAPVSFELGESYYRRSEQTWIDAGSPTARVQLSTDGSALHVVINVHAGDPVFARPDAGNPYDNEHPDTMAAGVQLHFVAADMTRAWMLVPEAGERVRIRAITGSGLVAPVARWAPDGSSGYEIRVTLPLPEPAARSDYPFAMDVLINETVVGRVRRRGQLVLSGARGEFVYLRGDRQDAERFLRFVITA